MNESKLKRMAMALKILNPDDEFEEILTSLGLSSQDLMGFLESLALDFQVSILTLDDVDTTKTRVFNLWEQAFISQEARDFLYAALYTKAIIPLEMEQALAVLSAQSQGYADVDEIRGILESIVEDPERVAVFGSLEQKFIH